MLRAIGAGLVIAIVGGVALLFVFSLGLGLFFLIASAGFGYLVAEGTSYAAKRKRGRELGIVAALGAVGGHGPIIALTASSGVVAPLALLGAGLAAFVAFVRLREP